MTTWQGGEWVQPAGGASRAIGFLMCLLLLLLLPLLALLLLLLIQFLPAPVPTGLFLLLQLCLPLHLQAPPAGPETTAAPSDATAPLPGQVWQAAQVDQKVYVRAAPATADSEGNLKVYRAHTARCSVRPAPPPPTTRTTIEGATTSHLKATLTKCQNVKKRDFTQAEMSSSRRRCSDKRANRAEQKGERDRRRERGQATVQQWRHRAAAARWAMLANKRSVELLLMS